jgi:two-component system, sensor histidine kinase
VLFADAGILLATPLASAPPRLPLRVLVVEDSDDSREMLMALLRLWGHEAAEASDGETGLARCVDARPDVALIDVGLPGLDGYELARRIRALPGSRPVFLVAVTGYGRLEDQERAGEAGFDAHLLKPVDPEVLRALLSGRAQR